MPLYGPPASSGSGIPATLVDAKGDLIVATANDTVARVAVGTDGYEIVADSAQTSGVKWAKKTVAATIIVTGSEARPPVDVWFAIDPDELGAVNALSTDPVIVPGAGGGGSGVTPTMLAAIVPPVASRWIMPPLVVNKGHDTTANGMMSLYRIEFTESVQITGLATDVFGDPGGSTVIRMGIYDSLTATAPISGTEKTVAASTGGNKIDTSLAVTLPAGVYWVACVPQGADAGVRHLGFPTSYHFWEDAHNALQLLDNWGDGTMNTRWVSGVTGTLPNLSTATLLHETTNPLAVALRIG